MHGGRMPEDCQPPGHGLRYSGLQSVHFPDNVFMAGVLGGPSMPPAELPGTCSVTVAGEAQAAQSCH